MLHHFEFDMGLGNTHNESYQLLQSMLEHSLEYVKIEDDYWASMLKTHIHYDVITIDFTQSITPHELYRYLSDKYQLQLTGNCDWNDFWNCINKNQRKPTNIIFYYTKYFSSIYPDEMKKIQNTLWNDQNDLLVDSIVINFDYPTGLVKHKFSTVFEYRPSQYGFAGDPYLWDKLEVMLRNYKMPISEGQLIYVLYKAIESTIKQSIFSDKMIYQKQFDDNIFDGSGFISSVFWVRRAIPLLIGRFRMLHGM